MKPWHERAGSIFGLLSGAFAALLASQAGAADTPRPVTIAVDAARSEGPLPEVWRFFGADEPNYATMKDGRKLLVELGKLRHGEVFFRAHNLLSTMRVGVLRGGCEVEIWKRAQLENKDAIVVNDSTGQRIIRAGDQVTRVAQPVASADAA